MANNDTQLTDAHGNPITPAVPIPSSMAASNITVAAGTGLNARNVQAGLKELNDKIETSGGGGGESLPYDVAIGNKDESCLINDATNINVGYNSIIGGKHVGDSNEDVVAIGHDDLQSSDYIGTRKIYNKYNFNATFNYILNPFPDAATKQKMCANVKRLIADGNEIGLHAVVATSFFWRNLMYDVRPDSTTTFSPTLAEMKTIVADGKNVFGISITNSSTFSTVKHGSNPSVASVLLANATAAQWFAAVSHYSVYASAYSVSGLDMNDQTTTKTVLQWLEHWYNELIDNTLGYSTYSGTIAERFAADYSGTYPDAAHILSGELSNYGTFTKGLFKGCHSCCNFEVLDRIISIAEAFCRYHFGLTGFTNMAYHGVQFADLQWSDSNGALYVDRTKNVLATGYTPLYLSLFGRKMNLFDIVKQHGIKMIKRNYPNDPAKPEANIGLYRGQKNIRGSYFNDTNIYQFNSYLALFASTQSGSGQDAMSYSAFMQYMPTDERTWHKWAYENAGTDVSGNGSMWLRTYYKNCIDIIRKCKGTGKIPFLGVDTIANSASIMAAVELICQYCYRHNIRITTVYEAMTIANKDRVVANAFPNPSFRQSLIEDFGGSSTSEDAYIPDGFVMTGTCKAMVVDESGNKALSLYDATSNAYLITRVYGLPSGKYKFTTMAKSTNSGNCISIGRKLNSHRATSDGVELQAISAGSTYEEVSYEFEIPEPHRNLPSGTYINTVCDGYEDNVAYIYVKIMADTGKTTSIYNPKIERV